MADRTHFRQDGLLHAFPDAPADGIDLARNESDMNRDRLAAAILAVSQEGVVITDTRNTIVDVNPAFTRITGHDRNEVIGKTPALLESGRHDAAFYASIAAILKAEGSWRGEVWSRRKNGETFPAMLAISAVTDDAGEVRNYVGVFSDISQMKQHEAELALFAHYDTLTGLPNRRLLADRMRQACSRAKRGGKLLAVCFLDLDGFKPINDQYGHEVGDALLVAVARCLQGTLRADDTLARLGGDEFVLLYNDFTQEEECCQALDRALVALSALEAGKEHSIALSASIGVTFYPKDNVDADTLLRHSDQCMYWAKQAGKNRYQLYDQTIDERLVTLRQERERIAEALAWGEFVLYFQPKINLISQAVIGAEALIRWQHPTRGLLRPDAFLPLIANTKLELALGEWVIEDALKQVSQWAASGLGIKVSVNVSPNQLHQGDFARGLCAALRRYANVRPADFELEIREDASLPHAEHAAHTLADCLALGVQLSLDDFGTGYSSLTQLRRLQVHTVKIDHSFVGGMLENPGDRSVVDSAIRMTLALNRQVIAEGVESARHTEMLIRLGCHFGQGYDIARPMPAADLPDWIDNRPFERGTAAKFG